MSEGIVIRMMRPDEVAAVSDRAMRTFDAFVGPDLTEEGVAAYSAYTAPEALRARQSSDHFTLVARVDGKLAGMIENPGNPTHTCDERSGVS